MALGTTAARAIAVEFAPAAAARLTDRELRDLALGRLSFGPGKRGANQSPMDGAIVVALTGLGGCVSHSLVAGFGRLFFAGGSLDRLDRLAFDEGGRFVYRLYRLFLI